MKVFEAIDNIEHDVMISMNRDEDNLCLLKKDLRTIIHTLIPIRRDKDATIHFCKYLKSSKEMRSNEESFCKYPKISLPWKELEYPLKELINNEYSFGHCRNYLNKKFYDIFSFFNDGNNRNNEVSDAMIDYAIEYDPETLAAACTEKIAQNRLKYFQAIYKQCHSIKTFDKLEPYFGLKKKTETFLLERINEESFFAECEKHRYNPKPDDYQEQSALFHSDEILFNVWSDKLPQERLKYSKDHPDTFKNSPLYDYNRNIEYFRRCVNGWLHKYTNEGCAINKRSTEIFEGYIRQLFNDYMSRVSSEFSGVFFPLQTLAFGWARETNIVVRDVASNFFGETSISVEYPAEMMCLKANSLYEEYVEQFNQGFWHPTDIVLYNFWGAEYLKNLTALQNSTSYSEISGFTNFSRNKGMLWSEMYNRITEIEAQKNSPAEYQRLIFDFMNWIETLLDDYFNRLTCDSRKNLLDLNLSVNHWVNVTQSAVSALLNFRLYGIVDANARTENQDDKGIDLYHSFISQAVDHFSTMYQNALMKLENLVLIEPRNFEQESEDLNASKDVQDDVDKDTDKQKKNGKPRILFEECILVKEDKESLISSLHSMLDGKRGKKAYIVLWSAIKAGLISRPSYNAVVNEFDIGGAESGFSEAMSSLNLPQTEWEPIANRIKELMKKQ